MCLVSPHTPSSQNLRATKLNSKQGIKGTAAVGKLLQQWGLQPLDTPPKLDHQAPPKTRLFAPVPTSTRQKTRAVSLPLNAGVEGAVVVGKLLEQDDPAVGYNAATGVYEDMIKAGVIDPVKVTLYSCLAHHLELDRTHAYKPTVVYEDVTKAGVVDAVRLMSHACQVG